jgi:hypothetical protein
VLDRLLVDTGAPASARWAPLAVWLSHNPKLTPWSLFVRRDGVVVAALVLTREFRLGAYKFETVGETNLPGWLPARDPESARALAVALASSLDAVSIPWVLHLNYLESTDPVLVAIKDQLARTTSETVASPCLDFREGEPLTTYLSANTRSALAKARNRIKNAGLVAEMEWTSSTAEIDSLLPTIMELYQRRTAQLGQFPNLLTDAAYRRFFADMAHAFAAEGLLRLLMYRLDGELASYAMCLQSGDTMLVYSNRMAPEWARYSPGAITNAEVVRVAHADPGVHSVDWGAGLQRYKMSGDVTLHPHANTHAWSSESVQRVWSWLHRRHGLRFF